MNLLNKYLLSLGFILCTISLYGQSVFYLVPPDIGFTINKYEYVTMLHAWDHNLEGAIINTSTQRILLKRSTFNIGYGISRYYNNFI